MTERRVEYIPLDQVEPARLNPRRHGIDGIRSSISRFGFATPALRDERTGRLVAGHGRTLALAAMRDDGEDPPAGVRLDGDRWLVPVVCGWSSRSDAEADAYLVADNRHTELAGWDDAGLHDLLKSIGDVDPELVAIAGFADEDIAGLLGGGTTELPPALTDPDDVPGLAAESHSKPGDVWLLGPHRLLVGDATDMVAVEVMLAGDRADCMWTDPPYGVDYVGKTKDALTIDNDGVGGLPELLAGAFAVATVALKPGAAVYVAHPPGPNSLVFADAIGKAGWSLRQQLIWVKDVMVLGHSDYHYRHEPIWMGYTDGGEGRRGRGGDNWHGDHAQTSVFEVPKPPRSEQHPTMKPVALVAAMLANSCPKRGLVYEPFGGSGSTLIAAHGLGMRAAVVELSPQYADVIARRFQEHAGEKPVLQATGKPHDFTRTA
jgi:DNA modification methylase